MRRTIKHLCSLAVILLLAIPVHSQVLLRVTDNTGFVGDTVQVSVYADSSLTGANATSLTMKLSYSDYYLQAIEANADSTIINDAGWVAVGNTTDPGSVSFSAAGGTVLTGSGRLMNIKFRIIRAGGVGIYFYEDQTYFNEGPEDVALAFDNGIIRGDNRPSFSFSFNPSAVVMGDSSQVSIYGANLPVTWSVSDTSLATIDAGGMLHTKTYGTVDVYAEDADGIIDTASVDILGFRLTSTDTTNYSGQEVVVNINTTDLTTLDLNSGSFFLSTSVDNRLEVLDVTPGDILDAGAIINYTVQSNGVDIAFAQAPTIVGSGNLLSIRMKLMDDQVFSNSVYFTNPLMNESIRGTGDRFYIYSRELPALDISYTSQRRYLVGDSLQFSVSNNTGPVTWGVTNPTLADIDANGLLISQKGGPFKVIAEDSIGAKGETRDFSFFDILIDLPNVSLLRGDTIYYPVVLSNLERSHSEVYGFDFTFSYDPDQLNYLGYSKSGSLTDSWSIVDNEIASNQVKIVGGAAYPFTQSGDMIYLKFKAKEVVSSDLYTYIRVIDGLFNEGSPNYLVDSGRIFVTNTPVPPTLVSPVNSATNVPVPVTLDWEPAAGADTYEVEVSISSSFAEANLIVDTTGVIPTELVVDGLESERRYYWRVKSHNATSESSFSSYLYFTTEEIENMAPVVASAIPDVTLMEDFGTVEYAKMDTVFSDPEGQPLTYSILNSLSFVQVDFAADTLVFYSVTDSSGSGLLVVQAEDVEGLTVTDTISVTINSVLDAPDLISPEYEAEDLSVDVTLDWEDEKGATSYGVQ